MLPRLLTPHRQTVVGPPPQSTRLVGWLEGVTLHPELTTSGGIQEAGARVCGSFCHPEGHQSDGSEVSAPEVYSTFHVSRVKPVHASPLAPARPPHLLHGSLMEVRCMCFSTWWIGRGMVQKTGLGVACSELSADAVLPLMASEPALPTQHQENPSPGASGRGTTSQEY